MYGTIRECYYYIYKNYYYYYYYYLIRIACRYIKTQAALGENMTLGLTKYPDTKIY
jgi:hypothetical protein